MEAAACWAALAKLDTRDEGRPLRQGLDVGEVR